jgi:glutamate-1-semialdehyde 2,1-aminomutase
MTIGPRDQALRERAAKVIPGGLWGHMNVNGFSPEYPQFFERAEGCTLWDVDGASYIDFMCSWGPLVLGHKHPRVEAAVNRQRALGDAMDGPAPVLVDLAELFVETIPFADWSLLQKNGSDATTACVTIARAGAGRRKILVAKGAYHGAVPWCSPSLAGVTAEDRAHLIHFTYNDIESLEAAAKAAEGDLAGILLSAFKHDYGQDQAMIDPAFLARARQICTAQDAALIIDDVRAGFRIDLRGSWAPYGVQPDLGAFSKAIANGYPLAAVVGNDRFRAAAGG